MRTIYYDHSASDCSQPGFRRGEAGLVTPNPEGGFDSDTRVWIAPNSLHALEQHGVVAELSRLEFAIGPLVAGRDAVLGPAALDEATHILYEADRKTYGNSWEFVVARDGRDGQGDPENPDHPGEEIEYRIVIDNREYQRTLARLQFLASTAGRQGLGVRLKL